MRGRGGDRGQINFDFAVGVSLFMISLIVAVTMVPSLFGGVTEGRIQGDQVAADRVASNLVEGDFGDPSRPNEIAGACAWAFFDNKEFCGFNSADVGENLAVVGKNINVSIVEGDEVPCWSKDHNGVLFSDDPGYENDCVKKFTGGENPESADEIASARRIATLEGRNVTIIVRVW